MIEIKTSLDILNLVRRESYYRWLSLNTQGKEHVLPRTFEFFEENSIFSVFAFEDSTNAIVGGAVIIPRYDNGSKNWLTWENRRIVEFGSNVVLPDWRKQHIGTKFVYQRLNFSFENDLFPVAVTKNKIITDKVFKGLALPVEDIGIEYLRFHGWIRDCYCLGDQKKNCQICPMANKTLFAFNGLYVIFWEKPGWYYLNHGWRFFSKDKPKNTLTEGKLFLKEFKSLKWLQEKRMEIL